VAFGRALLSFGLSKQERADAWRQFFEQLPRHKIS